MNISDKGTRTDNVRTFFHLIRRETPNKKNISIFLLAFIRGPLNSFATNWEYKSTLKYTQISRM